MTETVVLGLGNVLRRDEGLGIRALERLVERGTLPAEVTAVDGGTLGLDLISHVEGCRNLLVLDAVLAEGEPGTPVVLNNDAVPAYFARGDAHDVGLSDLLAVMRLRGTSPERLTVMGLRPQTIELGWELSPPVAAAIDRLADAAAELLSDWEAA